MKSFIALILSLILFVFVLPWRGVPDFEDVKKDFSLGNGSQTLLDRHGELLEVKTQKQMDRRQSWITLDSVPPSLLEAILTIEDRRFYQHPGVDFLALGALPLRLLQSGRARGTSTITMQLAGLLHEQSRARSRNVWQKLSQMKAALWLESRWTKAEILETYLNRISYRRDLVGLDAASLALFQKSPHGLTRAESWILASLLASPNASAVRVADKACLHVASALCIKVRALSETSLKQTARLPRRPSHAPHFARLFTGEESVVTTTIDRRLQRTAENAVRAHLASLAPQNVQDAAALVVNHRTGEILAYVGSSGELSKSREVDGVKALRQAGSTLKPFLYATAFEQNLLHPETLLADTELQIQTPQGLYSPQNYDETFKGPIPARIALASSLNIPAIRVIDLVGVGRFYQVLKDLGFTLKPKPNYGHSLALGAADVSLQQLVIAYAALARGGRALTLSARLPLKETKATPPLFAQATSEAITNILSQTENRSLTFGLENELATPYRAAVKTGTSKDMRDNWCLGYDETFVVGVWVGNFDGSPMWNVSGVSGAAPIWRTLMNQLQPHRLKNPSASSHALEAVAARDQIELIKDDDRPSITYPLDGMLIAFDPDIPADNQALVFEHSGRQTLYWQLDTKRLDSNVLPLTELPAGTHTLSLFDKDREILDSLRFEVRGKSSVVANSE